MDVRVHRLINTAIVAAAVLTTACASTLRVRTDHDPDANFKQYRTFALREGNSSGNPVMDQRIQADLRSALIAKGLDEVRPENADLIIVPNTATRTKRTYDTFYDTWGPGWRWRWARPAVYVNEFREGTLVVDAFDNKAKTAVWHGVASDVLADKPSENAEKVDKAVRELIQQYPS